MAPRRRQLIEARRSAHLSQERLAELLGADYASVSNWERALTAPNYYFRGKLKEFFAVEDLDALLEVTGGEEEAKPPPVSVEIITATTAQHFITSNPVRLFWTIAHTDYDTPGELITAIQTTIKDMTMAGNDPITRRDALCELASIPMMAMGRNATLKASRYEEMLKFCTAALQGCWHLMQGSDLTGRQHAFECCNTYVPLLESVARDSLPLRKQALDLATQYALLRTLLSWTGLVASTSDSVIYAQHAVSLSKETNDISLQVSACTKLTWSYLRNKNYAMGLKAIQDGERAIRNYQQKQKGPALLPGMVGNFNSSRALAQVYNGINPDIALGATLDSEPLKGNVAFVEFTEPDQHYETAKIYCLKGDPVRAIEQIARLIETNTEQLAYLPHTNLTEGVRLHTVNHLTSALLQLPERDMGQIANAWIIAMQGAQERHNEVIYDEAMQNFAVMRALWSKEDAIRRLVPLTSHW